MSDTRTADGKLNKGCKVCPKCNKDVRGAARKTCPHCNEWIARGKPQAKPAKVVAKAVTIDRPKGDPDPYTVKFEVKPETAFSWTQKVKVNGVVGLKNYPGRDSTDVNGYFVKELAGRRVNRYLENLEGYSPTEVSDNVVMV